MGITDFKGREAAQAWKTELGELNKQAETIMHGVEGILEEINNCSRGGMVDQLMQSGSQMVEATSKMVSAFAKFVSAIDTVLDIFSSAVGKVVDVVAGLGKIIGG